MLKKDDKDGIIKYLKEQLEKIMNYQIPRSQREDLEATVVYKDCCCPDCGDEFSVDVTINPTPSSYKYVHEDVIDDIKLIAEKALMEASF